MMAGQKNVSKTLGLIEMDFGMDYLKIHNWEKWQSYRADRGQPPWIKLHRRLLVNFEWCKLTDEQKGHLVSVWMLAADKEGIVPNDAGFIQKRCGLETVPDLQLFTKLGFIEPDAKAASMWRQDGVSVTAQSRSEEDSTDRKPAAAGKRGPSKKVTEISEAIAQVWNEKFGHSRTANSSVVSAVKATLKESPNATLEDFVQVVRHRLSNSDSWLDPKKYGVESLIRKKDFASHMERASEQGGGNEFHQY